AEADDDARHVGLKAALLVALQVADEIELEVDLLLGHGVGARDVEDGRLSKSRLTRQDGEHTDDTQESDQPMLESQNRSTQHNSSLKAARRLREAPRRRAPKRLRAR